MLDNKPVEGGSFDSMPVTATVFIAHSNLPDEVTVTGMPA